MKLKETNKPATFVVSKEAPTRKKLHAVWIGAVVLILYSLVIFFVGLVSGNNKLIDPNTLLTNSTKPFTLLKNQVSGIFSNPDHLYLDISHKHFQKLAYKRDVALLMGRLIAGEDDFVPASIRMKGNEVPIKLRLKGDLTDHLQGDKWSYRIKVKDDHVLYGMEEFSIQHPKTRNYLAEWVYHEALKREDIIALRYDFVEVSVNGKNQGIFAIEEHFNSKLIEHNKRRAGPIIRLSEEQMWAQHDEIIPFTESKPLSSAVFSASHLDAFESKAIAADSVYEQQFIRAISLFEALRSGKMRTRDVFDIEKMATYLAISELMGAHHSAIWNHMRFYYNPITGKLEPIGFDGNAGAPLPIVTASMDSFDVYENWRREIFYYVSMDPLFNEAYRHALHRISRPSYLRDLYKDIAPEFDQKLRVIHKSFPDYEFPYRVLENNRRHIFHVINPTDGLRVHVKQQHQDTLLIQAGSTQSLPVQLAGFHMPSGNSVQFKEASILPGRKHREGIAFTETTIVFSEPVTDSTLALAKASYRIPGVDSLLYVPVIPYPHSRETVVENDLLSNGPTDGRFEFLQKDEYNRVITAKPGTWKIEENLITPEGYSLHLTAGTTFDLVNRAALIIRGSVHFAGKSTSPIRVLTSDSTGQGLLVLSAPEQSEMNHVEFIGLTSLDQSGWAQTGSVTFHESDVSLSHVTFDGNHSEDALNIVRSTYRMDQLLFRNIYSDAFDGDFSDGMITNSVFERLGNDGIDVSGSNLTFQNVRIVRAGDKAVSAGEFSSVEGKDLYITESEIAIASKDNSVVTLTKVDISNSRLGVTLFQKKPEFGPASLEANDYVIRNTDVPSLIEQGSLFMVNGERIPANQKNVSDLLYGNLYGTASN